MNAYSGTSLFAFIDSKRIGTCPRSFNSLLGVDHKLTSLGRRKIEIEDFDILRTAFDTRPYVANWVYGRVR